MNLLKRKDYTWSGDQLISVERWRWERSFESDGFDNPFDWPWLVAITASVVLFFGLPFLMAITGYFGAVLGMLLLAFRLFSVVLLPTLCITLLVMRRWRWAGWTLVLFVVCFAIVLVTAGADPQ